MPSAVQVAALDAFDLAARDRVDFDLVALDLALARVPPPLLAPAAFRRVDFGRLGTVDVTLDAERPAAFPPVRVADVVRDAERPAAALAFRAVDLACF